MGHAAPGQVVIVSPLMRALETAAGAFGGGAYSGSGGRPLMLAQSAEEDERAAHAAVACPEGVPFIAFEGCRERLGAPQGFPSPLFCVHAALLRLLLCSPVYQGNDMQGALEQRMRPCSMRHGTSPADVKACAKGVA
jgi:hypothetical protein